MTMKIGYTEARDAVIARLETEHLADARDIAWTAAWLEACGYGGIQMLAEALRDECRSASLVRDAIGIDLGNVSCAFLAPAIGRDVTAHGRIFLRNVRHGLFLLPITVRQNIGIGCPVDPAFAVGGERLKNPYAEKLTLAAERGLEIGDAAWTALHGGT